eukprot:4714990-Pyramimonas_sp.AAC.1
MHAQLERSTRSQTKAHRHPLRLVAAHPQVRRREPVFRGSAGFNRRRARSPGESTLKEKPRNNLRSSSY